MGVWPTVLCFSQNLLIVVNARNHPGIWLSVLDLLFYKALCFIRDFVLYWPLSVHATTMELR